MYAEYTLQESNIFKFKEKISFQLSLILISVDKFDAYIED
jgi:hypothetical protein